MSTPRTDIHSPTNLVTEDYDFAYAYDAGEPASRGACMPLLNALLADGWYFDQVHGGDTCDHCGTRLRYVAVMKHRPTKTLIKVGETCLDNRFELATPVFHALRKQAKLNRERVKLSEKREAFLAIPANREAFEFCESRVSAGDYGYEGFYHNFVHKVNRYGDTSEKFVAAILRAKARDEEFAAKRAFEALTAAPVVEGDAVQITGEVLSLKRQENAYGGRLVMTVKDDRGFKVWGSVPSGLKLDQQREGRLTGKRVSFIAQVSKSDRDETFGFFKRPRKAAIV
jgi:hypothetical protein